LPRDNLINQLLDRQIGDQIAGVRITAEVPYIRTENHEHLASFTYNGEPCPYRKSRVRYSAYIFT